MDTSSPVTVLISLGQIEDGLAEAQEEHAELTGKVKRGEKFFKAYAKNLAKLDDAEAVNQKELGAWSIIHDHQEWVDYLNDVQLLGEADQRLEYWKTRATIGQSVLKQIGLEMQMGGRYGQGKGQPPTPQPEG